MTKKILIQESKRRKIMKFNQLCRLLFTILVITAALTIIFTLSGCDRAKTQLQAPDNVWLTEKGILRWNSVDGASGYIVSIDSKEEPQIQSTELDLSDLNMVDGQTYEVKVKAIGDGVFYTNSIFSDIFDIVYKKPNFETDDTNDTENSTDKPQNNVDESTSNDNVDNTPEDDETISDNIVNVPENNEVEFYIPHAQNNPQLKDSCTDNVHNYYLYYIGYLENFPLLTGEIIHHRSDSPDVQYQFSVTKESGKSIENTISTCIDVEKTRTFEVEAGIEVGNEVVGKGTFNVHHGWSGSVTTGRETSQSVASSWSESTQQSITVSLTNEHAEGYYRYVKYTKKCEVYVMVIYDLNSKEFGYNYITYSDETPYMLYEYSHNGNFGSNKQKILYFDESVIESINLNDSLEYRGTAPEIPSSPQHIEGDRHMCAVDTGYDLKTDGNSSDAEDHNGFEIGHITMYGCVKNDNGTYTIKDLDDFQIQYKFDEDPKKLPSKNELYISDDTEKNVIGSDIQNEKIGKGAYCIRITYKNGSESDPIVVPNFMAEKTVGSVVTMLTSDSVSVDSIAKIEITVVYELYFYASWFDHHHTNWRCTYVMNFY